MTVDAISDQPAVTIRDVTFAYNGLPVLEDVNLAVRAGESVSVVGPNGGGKTTLLKLMLGLLRPDRGEVRVFGRAPRQARSRIGYMPQHLHFDPQFPVTVREVVLMGRLGQKGLSGLLGWYTGTDRQAAVKALQEVGMAELVDRPFSELSGGQRQRVLVARALCSRPDLLLMDEPTANIDVQVEAQLAEILRGLNRRMTIVTVTHDLGFVSDLVDTVVCVNRRVVVHPTSQVTGEVIQDIYGGDVRMVRHDHRCSERGHEHD
jgi:zinc transport system ATP-binding protein